MPPRKTTTRKRKTDQPICSVFGCENDAFRRGLCRKHYDELKTTGKFTDKQGRALPTPIQLETKKVGRPPKYGVTTLPSALEIPEDGSDEIQIPQLNTQDLIDGKAYDELMKEALYWQAEQRKESAIKTKRQNDILEGKIIDVDTASHESFEMLSVLVAKLRQVQYVLTPQLVGQSNPKKIQDIIEKEINKVFASVEAYLNGNP